MISWKAIGIIAATFAAVGFAFDRLLLHRIKPTFHLAMTSYWCKLDETKIPDLAKLMAQWALNLFNRIFKWPLISWQSLIICIALSFILTSFAAIIGSLIEKPNFEAFGLPFYHYYFANFPYDLITLLITLKALILVKEKKTIVGLIAIVIDIVFALSLLILCSATIHTFDILVSNYSLPFYSIVKKQDRKLAQEVVQIAIKRGQLDSDIKIETLKLKSYKRRIDFFHFVKQTPRLLKEVIKSGTADSDSWAANLKITAGETSKEIKVIGLRKTVGWAWFFLVGTTLIPTIIYLFVLLLLILGKLILKFFQIIMMYFLELLTQIDPCRKPDKFMPGTLIGILFGLIATIAKAVQELIY